MPCQVSLPGTFHAYKLPRCHVAVKPGSFPRTHCPRSLSTPVCGPLIMTEPEPARGWFPVADSPPRRPLAAHSDEGRPLAAHCDSDARRPLAVQEVEAILQQATGRQIKLVTCGDHEEAGCHCVRAALAQ